MGDLKLTIRDLAILEHRHPNTIRRWIERGLFPHAYQPCEGGGWRIPVSDYTNRQNGNAHSHELEQLLAARLKRQPVRTVPVYSTPQAPSKLNIDDSSWCLELSHFLANPCIYFLVNHLNEVLYIGKSVNPLLRIASHWKHIAGIARVYVHPCASDKLDETEDQFIRKYLPPYNITFPLSGERICQRIA